MGKFTAPQVAKMVDPTLRKLSDPKKILTKFDRDLIAGYINLLEVNLKRGPSLIQILKFKWKRWRFKNGNK